MSTGRLKKERKNFDWSYLSEYLKRQKIQRRLNKAFKIKNKSAAKVRIEDDCVPPKTTRKGKKQNGR